MDIHDKSKVKKKKKFKNQSEYDHIFCLFKNTI